MKGYEQKVLEAGFSHYMTKPIDLDRLTSLLAELLGGSFVEIEESGKTTNEQVVSEQVTSQTDATFGAGPVYSSMAQQNPKFEAIAKQFVERLTEKLEQMQQCADEADFTSLAKHAHWLKGSGGTVGFTDFVEPAKALEAAAKQSDAGLSNHNLTLIRDIQGRISFDYDAGTPKATGTENVSQFPETNHVTPSLPMANHRFRGIVERYLPRLDEQITAIHDAIEAEDFEQLASIAHWLKGSGGNVGFDGFTELATVLESAAKSRNSEQIAEQFKAILSYSERVKLGWELLDPFEKSA